VPSGSGRYDAVLLDAYGTLVELDDPFERLRAAVRRHLGADVEPAEAERAFRIEMAYYSDRCHLAGDAEGLAALRADCARILLAELGSDGTAEAGERVLSDAVAFRLLPGVEELLAGLEDAGVASAVVSNWDFSLRHTLAGLGLGFDAIVTCGETGVRKPDPRIFVEALGRLGVEPGRALHVGDSADTDGAGAAAAGIDARILDRTGDAGGRGTIAALTDVLELL
jgi:HAD superfamily hydrolase (TIGR01549 family)